MTLSSQEANIRTISFVERLELEFLDNRIKPANLCQQAISLGDVDNDERNELVVGSISGYLKIYKGQNPKPWKSCKDLGMISCTAIGDVCNKGMNFILVLSADGWCHVFQVNAATADDSHNLGFQPPNHELKWTHRQHLSANSKVMMVADIDDDGAMEITVGFSDRVVRTYRWFCYSDDGKGEFVSLQKWTLRAQIGSISINCENGKPPDLVVSQSGATYVILKPDGQTEFPISSSARTRNTSVYTEIVGNVSTSHNENMTYHALCTQDGTIMLLNSDAECLWEFQVDHQLFGLTKLDITEDGVGEVIACSWDGQTYIVNSNKQIARFQFDEPTAAFVAGHYSVGDRNESCLIYITFDGRIYIYHNIKLAQVQSVSLIEALNGSNEVKTFMKQIGMDETDKDEQKKLYQWCLYGRRPNI